MYNIAQKEHDYNHFNLPERLRIPDQYASNNYLLIILIVVILIFKEYSGYLILIIKPKINEHMKYKIAINSPLEKLLIYLLYS